MVFQDQMGREVPLLHYPPERIISLVPSQTELLFGLGVSDKVVGVTKFCVHPSHIRKEKTIIGGTKNFRFDVIDALSPDLIIGNKEENYEQGILVLASKYPVWMSDIYTLEDSFKMMHSLGQLTGSTQNGQILAQQIKEKFNALILPSELIGKSVAYFIWNNPLMVVGHTTFIDYVLRTLGFVNSFQSLARYPSITTEQLAQAPPDFIFLSSEPFPFKEDHKNFFKEICPNSVIEIVDGEMFSWYGSRLAKAPDYFQELFSQLSNN